MFSKLTRYTLISFALILASCSVQVKDEATAIPFIITATLQPTLTPRPTETPQPTSPPPTVAPAEGTASTQINVRAQPSTTSDVLGIIAANTKVEIVGKDPGGNWWQILYPQGEEGKGWVTAQYVQTASQPEVPVIGGDASNPTSGNSAVVIQKLNIRSGPGTSFNSLGVLNPNDVVNLTGKNSTGTWLQIQFQDGPDGKGWVNAGFVKVDQAETLPIVSDVGEVIGTGTPADTPLPPTPTIVAASMDNDSAEAPIRSVTLDSTGTSAFIYIGDVSAPEGDTDDWIAFTPDTDTVLASIECTGSGSIKVLVGSNSTLTCGEPLKVITVQSGKINIVHIQAVSASGNLQYTRYTLTIRVIP